MSDMVKYRAAIWSFLKLTALHFTMSDIVHGNKISIKTFCGIPPLYKRTVKGISRDWGVKMSNVKIELPNLLSNKL